MHIGLVEFLAFVCYYIILKAILQLVNVEARRAGMTRVSAVSGLLA